ncbi:MAG: N-acetylglucosamine-6-phosphate deacetylase [Pseudomonadota bacterium]
MTQVQGAETGKLIFSGGPIFDGGRLHTDCEASFADGRFLGLTAPGEHDAAKRIDLEGDILSTGYVDLQVNGGGGLMVNDLRSATDLGRIAEAHRRQGTLHILPTLITDTPQRSRTVIGLVIEACRDKVPGIAGLHLEGPHLDPARKGAHDGNLIRTMTDEDLQELIAARTALPALMLTVASEAVTLEQVAALAEAGVLVSLGHTNADFDTAKRYFAAGARSSTHLFNAMSGFGHRAPGVVGATLENGDVAAGLIADGIHVHRATMGAAWRAKKGRGDFYLVSDAMAVAGTRETGFALQGRQILRRNGRLTLPDGTLAGADLDLTTALKVMVEEVGVDLGDALRAATTTPANLISLPNGLVAGETPVTSLIRIKSDLSSAAPLV